MFNCIISRVLYPPNVKSIYYEKKKDLLKDKLEITLKMMINPSLRKGFCILQRTFLGIISGVPFHKEGVLAEEILFPFYS